MSGDGDGDGRNGSCCPPRWGGGATVCWLWLGKREKMKKWRSRESEVCRGKTDEGCGRMAGWCAWVV